MRDDLALPENEKLAKSIRTAFDAGDEVPKLTDLYWNPSMST